MAKKDIDKFTGEVRVATQDSAGTPDPQRRPAAGLATAAQDDPGQKLMASASTSRRPRAAFLHPLPARSRRLQQTENATRRAQAHVFAGCGAFSGKEPDREQREKMG
ncbi:hypothetical protein ABO04_10440 [Nitrosomonas sp. HPC101]|nr:hypothetical protein [Nitrosomonas sp. HPC101]